VLVAAQLALIATDPKSGRHALGTRDLLNACLAGLLVAEAMLEQAAVPGDAKGTLVVTGSRPADRVLAAATEVIAERGPKIKPVLSHMDRGLKRRLGTGTWDTMVGELVDAGALAHDASGGRPAVADTSLRDAIVERLRMAATGDDPLDPRTALLLSMTGPAHLLELVAPDRATRKHARRRIDHALDADQLDAVGESVRALLAEAAAVVAVAASVAATAAVASS
jgi:hypothetical protein